MRLTARLTARLALSLLVAALPLFAQAPAAHWVGTWATAPMGFKNPTGTLGTPAGTTLREIVHVSIGGSSARIVVSNEFGAEPLTITAAAIAQREAASSVVPSTSVPVLFQGRSSVIIPPGALIVSDAAPIAVKPLSDLAVSLFLPAQPLTTRTAHSAAYQTNYSAEGNAVSADTLPDAKPFTSWDYLKEVDVQAPADGASIVAFGDSITDGAHSTRDGNARWPDVLARRLAADPRTAHLGVLNLGIGGNRVLHDGTGPSALARFDRDVLAQAGVHYVILMESINDIGHAADPAPAKRYDIVTAQDLIGGLAQLARRAHTHGLQVFGATLTPYVGAGYQSPEGERMRQAVNDWIRSSKDLDGVIDFDQATRDPAHPGVFLPADDSGDHLHPGDAGYKAMGDAVPLALFTR